MVGALERPDAEQELAAALAGEPGAFEIQEHVAAATAPAGATALALCYRQALEDRPTLGALLVLHPRLVAEAIVGLACAA